MKEGRPINYLSVENISLDHLACGNARFFHNQHLSIILNGKPLNTTFFQKEIIYHVAEARLILILKGCVEGNLNLEDQYIEQGHVLLLPADSIMELKECSDDLEVIAFIIREKLLIDESLVFPTSPKDFQQLLKMTYLTWDLAQHTPFRKDVVLPIVQAIVVNIQCIYKEMNATTVTDVAARQQQLFQNFKHLVQQYCELHRNIPFYAEQLHITPHYLSAVIKETSGQSVMFWINRSIILRAKVLLNTKGMMIYEIADRLNFTSPSAFHNFFKRITGLTPKEYQMKMK
jgi:transcriptional regulator, araC family